MVWGILALVLAVADLSDTEGEAVVLMLVDVPSRLAVLGRNPEEGAQYLLCGPIAGKVDLFTKVLEGDMLGL